MAEKFLSQIDQCFACPVGTPLTHETAFHTNNGRNYDHIVPHQAKNIYRRVVDPFYKKPFNKALVCWGHHEATDVYKKEEFELAGMLGVVRFLAFDYLRPALPGNRPLTLEEEELRNVWLASFSTLFKALRDNIVSAMRFGPTGKITKSRMVGFPQAKIILEAGLDFFQVGELYIPKSAVQEELDLLEAA